MASTILNIHQVVAVTIASSKITNGNDSWRTLRLEIATLPDSHSVNPDNLQVTEIILFVAGRKLFPSDKTIEFVEEGEENRRCLELAKERIDRIMEP